MPLQRPMVDPLPARHQHVTHRLRELDHLNHTGGGERSECAEKSKRTLQRPKSRTLLKRTFSAVSIKKFVTTT